MEAILTRFVKQVLSPLLVVGLLIPAAFAGSKESPHDTLVKSFQQANLWTQGPVKLSAKIRMPKPDGTDVNLDYTISWAGPDKWRAEWTANGFDQVTVLNAGKLSFFTSLPSGAPLVRAVPFEQGMAALDGSDPAGPYTFPPFDLDKQKFDLNKKKVNGVDAKCIDFGQPLMSFCVDAASGRLLTVTTTINGVEMNSVEYSDYATFGNATYPQTIKVTATKQLVVEGKMTVTRGDKFDDKLFAPPDKSTVLDFNSCADVDKNFTAPHLTKPVAPKMSDAAKKAKKYGMVSLLATVGKDGSVTKTVVLAGDPDLNQSAIDAVKQYKFTPYLRCGQAVEFEQIELVPFLPPQKLPEEGVLPSR